MRRSSLGCIAALLCTTALPASAESAPRATRAAAAAASARASLADALTGAAKAEYDAARLLVDDGDFAGAVVKFRHAWEIAKDPRLLWNIAACEKNLRHYARALHLLEEYRTATGDLVSVQDRRDALEAIRALQSLVSAVRVSTNVAGAEVFVDGESVGTTPIADPVVVDLGRRRVRVTKRGYVEFVTDLDATGGGEARVDARLRLASDSSRASGESSSSDLVPYGLIALGLIGVGVGVGEYVHARSENAAAVDGCHTDSTSGQWLCANPQAADEQQRSANRDAVVADVAMGVGGAALIGGVVWLLARPAAGTGDASLQIAPSFGAGTATIAAKGTW